MRNKSFILTFLTSIVIVYALFLNFYFPKKSNGGTFVIFSELENAFSDNISRYIPGDSAGLGIGYLLGEKDKLPENLKNEVKIVSMSHIIVVSGTHLAIILSFAKRILKNISRLMTVYFSIFCLGFYVLMIGLSPSLVRASFVAVLGLITWYFGRDLKPARTILLTLGFCLFVNPYYLTNLSFQLSMLAYSGILIFLPRLIRYFYGRDKPSFVASTIFSTFSAVIMCLPMQLYYFGTFNILSFVANLLILPTIPLAMGLMFLTGLFGLLSADIIAKIFGCVAGFILDFHVSVIHYLADKTEFLFEFPKNQIWFLMLYILVFLMIALLKNGEKIRWKKKMNDWESLNEKKIF